jgi:hypothetical protein
LKALTPIAFLLLCSLLSASTYAAQSIVIPQGTTVYGPFNISAGHKRAEISFQTTSSNFTKMTIVLDCFANGAWAWRGTSVYLGGGDPIKPIGSNKGCQIGATQIRATVTLEGGSVTISQVPNLRSR